MNVFGLKLIDVVEFLKKKLYTHYEELNLN